MGVKHGLKQILTLMVHERACMRSLSAVLTVIMALQLSVVPASAGLWPEQTQVEIGGAISGGAGGDMDIGTAIPRPGDEAKPVTPEDDNTYALVVATGGQSGDAIEYFKVVYEDTNGIRRSEYIFRTDHLASFAIAQEYGNREDRRKEAVERFDMSSNLYNPSKVAATLQAEQRDTYLFKTLYDVNRIVGVEIMQNAGQWDCQGLWVYQVDQIYGQEMYGYVSGDSYISFSGWRLAELEMNYKSGQIVYTMLQNARPKLYRMGENGHPEFNLITYDRSEAKYESTDDGREYAMRLDITDIYKAGIESSLKSTEGRKSIGESVYRDSLQMEIRYQDTFGCVQTFSVHVLPSFLLWALDNGVSTSEVLAGLGHQGDTLLVPMKIPHFADLLGVTLHYYGTNVNGEEDSINLSSVSMYDLTLSLADVAVDPARAAIVPSITYNPVYFWKTSSRQGYVMNGGDSKSFKLKFNEDSAAIVDEPLVDEYLVEITTDEMSSAATTGDVSVVLNYVTYNGVEQRTEKIMLREQSKDFHGETPGGTDMYYWMAMRPGGTLHFRVNIPNVSRFTGVTFALEDSSADEWQMSGFNIYRLDEVSRREVVWGNFTAGNAHSDRYYDRSFEGDLIFSGTRSVLVQQGDPVEVNESEGGAYSESTLPDASVAWSDIKYSMSYEEALQNIGFSTERNSYQVEVTVAGNSALAGTEDAGSKNQFYFQLLFQDGNSGYVLANQQLGGDGFRAGYTETFTVRTNQDYGELVSVRIIPEDVSSKSDYFDKLNIESIQVMRSSDGGLSRQWSVERVGWIDIDFRDEGAASGMLGQKGRTEEELARSFNVTYGTYAVNLLVSLTTLGMPFSGTVYGDMCYYNGAGEVKHKGFDIVKLMYEYANKTPDYNSSLTASGSMVTSGSAWSDGNMFRADHTDRFIITLSDARELAYLDIDAYMAGLNQGEGGTWHIGGVAVSLIESEGNLLLNANDEYERDNAVRLLTTNVDTNRIPAYQLLMEHNAKTSQRIHFIENKIDLDIKSDNVSVLSREPISQNDVLNIYVYPNLEKSEASTAYTMRAAATYTSPQGMRQTSAGTLNLSSDGTMFYMIGVKASGMTVLNELSIQADNPLNIPNAYIDRAIVQQVRSGVIINTYEIDFNDASAAYGASYAPVTELAGYEKTYVDEQVVMLSIGEGLEEPIMLQPETKDLAVALSYVPEHTAEEYGQEYDTPFVYLTDQQITMLRSGQTISVTFTEDYIGEITGVVMVATGGLSIPVDMACVSTYRVAAATGERVERSYYSFAEFFDGITGTEVARTDRRLGDNGDSVKPLKLQFVTAPATTDMESGVNGSVELTISYEDDYGTIRTKTIPDLRLYATTPTPFATDTVTDVELLVSGIKELRWLKVRPYDDKGETDVSWNLSSVSAQLGLTGEVQKRIVDDTKAILESAGRKINYSAVSVLVNVYAQSNTGEPTNINAQNESVNILLDSGQMAQMQVSISGSDEGYNVKAERASSLGATATADAGNYLTQIGDTLLFNPGNNYTGANIYYRITVTSNEVGSKTVINFEQSFEKEPEPIIVPEGEGEGIGSESDSDSGDGADAGSGSDSGSSGGGSSADGGSETP